MKSASDLGKHRWVGLERRVTAGAGASCGEEVGRLPSGPQWGVDLCFRAGGIKVQCRILNRESHRWISLEDGLDVKEGACYAHNHACSVFHLCPGNILQSGCL